LAGDSPKMNDTACIEPVAMHCHHGTPKLVKIGGGSQA